MSQNTLPPVHADDLPLPATLTIEALLLFDTFRKREVYYF
jgi:hypothetical protein